MPIRARALINVTNGSPKLARTTGSVIASEDDGPRSLAHCSPMTASGSSRLTAFASNASLKLAVGSLVMMWLYSAGHTETRVIVTLERCVR